MLNGDYQPTSGKYLLDGVEKHFQSPHQAIEEGISVIYQERQILLELSVAENIYLGRMPVNRFGFIDTQKANQMASKIIEDFGLPIHPSTKSQRSEYRLPADGGDHEGIFERESEGNLLLMSRQHPFPIQRSMLCLRSSKS